MSNPLYTICHRVWAWFYPDVITRYGKTLGPTGIAVYVLLAMYRHGNVPPQVDMARTIGTNAFDVYKSISQLKALGLIDDKYRVL